MIYYTPEDTRRLVRNSQEMMPVAHQRKRPPLFKSLSKESMLPPL